MILSILSGILFISSSILIFKNIIGRNGACFLLIGFNSISFISLLILLLFYPNDFELTQIVLWSNSASSITVPWGFFVDKMSFVFMLTIFFISTIIIVYSISYMYTDNRIASFISFLGFFVFFMLVLILSNNFIQMFIGWEGVGLVSFLLVNFWYNRLASNKGALKALIFNRLGDVGFVLFICLMIKYHGTVIVPFFNVLTSTSNLILLLVFLAAAGKSAQLLLYAWLPDAMEGENCAFLKLYYMRETPIFFWSTQNTSLFGKIQKKGQSAGNQILLDNNKVGSSETIRVAIDDKFKYWLIGFTEGDGSFIVNKNNTLEFKITQSSNDAQILFYIKKQLGFGSVTIQDKKQKTHHYRVRNKQNFLNLISIFNGNLLTEKKQKQFEVWLEKFNIIYKEQIVFIYNKNEFNLNTSWLSGFIDAEGCFTATLIKRENGYNQVQVRFILSQKNEKFLLENIANVLGGKLSYLESYQGYNMTVNLLKLNIVINYIKKYKLLTKKHISFLQWLKVYYKVKNKEHFDMFKIKEILKLIKKINK